MEEKTMTAVTLVKSNNQGLTPELEIHVDEITVTSDYTYTPAAKTGKNIRVLACYNNTDGAIVKVTQTTGVLTLGNGQSLSAENCVITYAYFDA